MRVFSGPLESNLDSNFESISDDSFIGEADGMVGTVGI